MHFTNGEAEIRSGEAEVIARTLGCCGRGVPRNLTEAPCSFHCWSDGNPFAHGLGPCSPSPRVFPTPCQILGKVFLFASHPDTECRTNGPWPLSEWLPSEMHELLSCQLGIWGFFGLVSKWCLTLPMLLIEHSPASQSQMRGVC